MGNIKESTKKDISSESKPLELFKPSFNESFIEEYFNKSKDFEYSDYKIFNIFHKLIAKLINEHKRPWTVKSLKNYINNLYKRAIYIVMESSLDEKDKQKIFFRGKEYHIFNTNLFDKNKDEVFFITNKVDDEKKFIPLDNFGFFTIPELEKIKEINEETKKGIIEKCKGIKNISFEEIKYDIKKIKGKIELHYEETSQRNINDSIGILNEYIGDLNKCKKINNKPEKPKTPLRGWHHIIVDGIDNFPIEFINQYFNERLHYLSDRKIIDLQLKLLKNKNAEFDNLKEILESAIEDSLSLFKVKKNFIAPSYYVTENRISYLLPLNISHRGDEKPDFVLLFNIKSNKYTEEDYEKDIENNLVNNIDNIIRKYQDENNIKFDKGVIEASTRPDFAELITHLENEDEENVKKIVQELFNYYWSKNLFAKSFDDVKDDFRDDIAGIVVDLINEFKSKYIAKTLLNLDEAYINVRLLNEENHYHWLS